MRNLSLLLLFIGLVSPIFSQTNYFSVKFPDDRTYIGCNASVPVEQPVVTQYACNINVGISRFDQIFNSNESGSCFKILRRWRLIYWCDYDANLYSPTYIPNPSNSDVGPTVIGNSANHGYLEYIQIIKVRDDAPPVFSNCPASPVVYCDYTANDPAQYTYRCEGPVNLETDVTDVCSGTDISLAYLLYLDLDGNGSMETVTSSSAPGAWPIETSIVGNVVHGHIGFPTNYQLPYGTHKVEWIAGDHCGNESTCKYEFIVKDCKKPTVTCINGLSVNIMQTGMITLNVNSFLQYVTDNCSTPAQIQIGIRKAGTGTGFPTGTSTVNFDCNETGTQLVEIWAQDASGNADFCQTYVNIQDNSGACAPTASLTGTVLKSSGAPMNNVQLQAQQLPYPAIHTTTTNENGQFAPMALLPGCYTLTPIATENATDLNGISTWDALMAGLHGNGVEYLEQPWQYAAADVNHDHTINEADATAIIQMAIGAANQWPGVNTWQLIPANAAVPESEVNFPLTQTVCIGANETGQAHWQAIKSGDLDGSGSSNITELEDRSAPVRRVIFTAPNQHFEAGDLVQLTISTPNITGLAGFQFTLDYDAALLSPVNTVPGLTPVEQTARFDNDHQITAGWQSALAFYPDGASLYTNQTAMTFEFTALQGGQLMDAVQMSHARIRSEVYTREHSTREAGLRFTPAGLHKNQAYLLPPVPNPVQGNVMTVRYLLPAATQATLVLTDINGKILVSQDADGNAGYHEVVIPVNDQPSGVGILQLITAEGVEGSTLVQFIQR